MNAAAASSLLAAGGAPDTVEPLPNAKTSVQVNMEQNTPLRVVDGLVRQTFHLRPGQRGEIVYRVNPNTSQVIVSLSNFVAAPVPQQNQLSGDTLTFGIHSAQTSDGAGGGFYLSDLEHLRTGTRIVNNPEPGLMRIVVNGSWRNAGNVAVDVCVAVREALLSGELSRSINVADVGGQWAEIEPALTFARRAAAVARAILATQGTRVVQRVDLRSGSALSAAKRALLASAARGLLEGTVEQERRAVFAVAAELVRSNAAVLVAIGPEVGV